MNDPKSEIRNPKSSRRRFLSSGLLLAGGAVLGWQGLRRVGAGPGKRGGASGRSRVAIVRDRSVRAAGGEPDPDRVLALLDRGMETLFDAPSATEVWAELIKPSDTLGLKVNCLAGRGLSTHLELVQSIVQRVTEVGLPHKSILIWDRLSADLKRAGYPLNIHGDGVRCYGNDVAGYVGAKGGPIISGSVGSFVSRALMRDCSVIINLPVLKDHGICGITLAMKNFFGAIHNPNKYHGDVGDPYIADLNMLPEIREKTVLTISDALIGQYEGGPPYMPQWAWQFDGLVLGTDPVALDRIGWDLIEERRAEKGLPSLKEAGREPTYIATAADRDHRIGVDDRRRIDVIEG